MIRAALSPLTHNDPATYLPRKPIQEYPRRHTIYGPGETCSYIYLVRAGRVAIHNSFDGSNLTVSRIVGPGGFFGEGMLIGGVDPMESAVVLDATRLMSWSRAEIEQLITADPRLGIALVGYFVQRCAQLNARMEALAFRRTPERVMLGLLQLAETLGTPVDTGLRLAPLTHQTIAEFVGTSREIVTSHMTEFRRAGLLQYSRKYIDVNVSMMRATLLRQGIQTEAAEIPMARAAH
jgi:CRP/FNR family transcriptional regulator